MHSWRPVYENTPIKSRNERINWQIEDRLLTLKSAPAAEQNSKTGRDIHCVHSHAYASCRHASGLWLSIVDIRVFSSPALWVPRFLVSLFDRLALSIPAFSVAQVLTWTNRVLEEVTRIFSNIQNHYHSVIINKSWQSRKCCDKFVVLTVSVRFYFAIFKTHYSTRCSNVSLYHPLY